MFSGRGGLIPSLATNNFNNFAVAKTFKNPRANKYAYISLPYGRFLVDRFK